MKKKILVMGGSYFIGKKIVDVLLKEDHELSILNRGSNKNSNPNIHSIISDRNDDETMKSVLKGLKFDIIVDVSGVNKKQINILLDSIDSTSLKQYIFISSSAVYDIDNLNAPFKETDFLKGNSYWSSYAENKIQSENTLIEFFKDSNTIVSILRPPLVYGENNYAPRETFVFDHIINDKAILLPNKGDSLLQFIYTGDLANIISKLIEKAPERLNIYNVGNKEALSMRKWIKQCEVAVNKKAIIIEYDYKKHNEDIRNFFPFFDYDNVLDVTKINKIYSVETPFAEGLKKAYDWYIENIETIKQSERITVGEQLILKKLKIQ